MRNSGRNRSGPVDLSLASAVRMSIKVYFILIDPLLNEPKGMCNTRCSVYRLDDLHAKDLAKMENERAKNSLESFLYDFKDKLYSDTIEEMSTEDERSKITEKFSEISDWLDDEGFDSTADVSLETLPH